MLRIVTIILFVLTLLIARAALAEPEQLLAKVCWIEATWRHDDCAAIVYVLKKRAKRIHVSVEEMAHSYSALKTSTPRAAEARALPAGLGPRGLLEWSKLLKVAAGALTGVVPNPCPGAGHWGARNLPGDLERALDAIEAGSWRVVKCRSQTANAFYAERRRRN